MLAPSLTWSLIYIRVGDYVALDDDVSAAIQIDTVGTIARTFVDRVVVRGDVVDSVSGDRAIARLIVRRAVISAIPGSATLAPNRANAAIILIVYLTVGT